MLYDYIILGGGIAGLHLANQLSLWKSKPRILILEKEDYLGGRIYTYHDRHMSVEAGAGRFNSKHQLLLKLIRSLHLDKNVVPISSTIGHAIGKGDIYYEKQGKSIYSSLVNKVYRASKKMSIKKLTEITYLDFAKQIVGEEGAEFLMKTFGFTLELTTMNAYDAIEIIGSFLPNNQFYGLKGGMNQIVDRLETLISDRVDIHLSRNITNIIDHKTYWVIHTLMHHHPDKHHVYHGKTCISTLPAPILKQMPLFEPMQDLLNQIVCGQLCRIYCKFDPHQSYLWFQNLGKFTADNDLRMVIPIDLKQGVIMASYTDGEIAERWKTTYHSGGIQAVNDKLKELYKELGFDIGEPLETRMFFWACGVGYWTLGANSKKTSRDIVNPYNQFYICGENFSETNQQWIEGALETADNVLEILSLDKKYIKQ